MARRNSLSIFLRLPGQARLLVVGTLINQLGALIGPFLALILVGRLGLSPTRASWVLGSFSAGTFLSVLAGGWLTDTLGRRRTMLISLFGGGALATLLAGIASTPLFYPLLLVFGFLTDLFRPASSTMLSDVLGTAQRSTGFGAMRVAANLGLAVSTIVGGFLIQWNWRALFVVDGVTTIAFGAIVLRWLVEPPRAARGAPRGLLREIASVFDPVARDRVFRLNMIGGLVLATVFTSLFTVLPLTVTRSAGYSERVFGGLLSMTCLLVVTLELTVVDWISRFRRQRMIMLGASLIGVGYGILGLVPHWAWFALALVIITMGEICSFALMMAFNVDWAPPASRGQYVSFFQATWRVATVVGPLIFLPLYERLPLWQFWLLMPVAILPVLPIFEYIGRNYDQSELLRLRASS